MSDTQPLLYTRVILRNGQSGLITIVHPDDGNAYVHFDVPAETVQGSITGTWVRLNSADFQVIEPGNPGI